MKNICDTCATEFEITEDDLTFYKDVSPVFNGKTYQIPPPTLCPLCRYRRRLLWRNERTLYRRTCDATGREIVSIYAPEKVWPPVYEQEYWWSDHWDPKDYGKDFDWNRPFFEQFAELYREVPQLALNNQQSENSTYTNQAQYNKDCYMIVASTHNRECYYGMWFEKSESSMDCLYLERSELCYEVLNGQTCYRCTFSQNLNNCTDVHFSRNCIGCRNCFGCTNLRNKQYYAWNKPLSKSEYHAFIHTLSLDRYSSIRQLVKEAADVHRHIPCKYYAGHTIENASGDYLQQVKNTHDSFNCRHTENIRYCQDAWEARNCQDLTETLQNDYSVSIEGCGITVHSLFSMKLWDTHDVLYCSHAMASRNLFGCVSMKHGEYCILNKQYTRETYQDLVPKIMKHMQRTEEWGQHFPAVYSPFAYNETVAQDYFPLEEISALAQGYTWRNPDDATEDVSRIVDAATLPDSMSDIPDDILNWALECEATKRPFKIIKQELAFYRQMNLPVPRLHPDERHRRRMALRNPRALWDRTCSKCGVALQSSFAPERTEIVYCEHCYINITC